ncbi:MAG: ABC transporter ATP-binding protein [Pseudomonadota bacterium]
MTALDIAPTPVPATLRLELRGVTKRFPRVLANDNVDLSVAPGEIHALLGENGAGKSTLVKMIYGLMAPDAGTLSWEGTPRTITSPKEARRLGINMVFQHFSLFEAMSVLDNIALGLDERLPRRRLEARIRAVLDTYGLSLDPRRSVATLSVGERQRIEIVRALLVEPKLLIMDEPTSVLTPQEAEQLFATLRALAERGCAILYISHKLHEIRALCARATILRGGRVVAACEPRHESPASLAEMMIGARPRRVEKARPRPGPVKLALEGLSLPGEGDFGVTLEALSLEVRGGEIVGIAGVAGNGQSELFLALSGERLCAPEAVTLNGHPAGRLRPEERRAHGLSAVPEERLGHAGVPEFSLSENTLLTARHRRALVSRALVRPRRAAAFAAEVIARFDVRTTGPRAPAAALSGGNLQKFVVGREILQAPEVLVVSQPTWGVDAGAAAAIHQALADLAAGGAAILVISQDLDELFALTDRLAVLNGGRLSAPEDTASVSVERIGLLMGGLHGEGPHAR